MTPEGVFFVRGTAALDCFSVGRNAHGTSHVHSSPASGVLPPTLARGGAQRSGRKLGGIPRKRSCDLGCVRSSRRTETKVQGQHEPALSQWNNARPLGA